MDIWKYFAITHKNHTICNPMSLSKFQHLIDIINLKRNARILEIACGKGEFIIRTSKKYNASGIAIDISPYFIKESLNKANKKIKFIEMDGANFKTNELFDLVACIGASWIFNGHRNTLLALSKMVKKNGLIIVGEPFWLKKPSKEYLKATGGKLKAYGTHYTNILTGEKIGLTFNYTIVSNKDDWDKYEGLQWYAVNNYVRDNPDDSNNDELLKRINKCKTTYLKWGRDTIGWAIYVFSK